MAISLPKLTTLIFELNAMMDRGHILDLAETESRIEDGSLIRFLAERFKGEIDLSLIQGPEGAPIVQGLQALLGAHAGRERRKWGVERNGLCLLIAWVTELIQQRKIWE